VSFYGADYPWKRRKLEDLSHFWCRWNFWILWAGCYTRIIYGGSLFGGKDIQKEIDVPGSTSYYSLGILPYADFNSRWFGVGMGVSLGYQNYVPTSPFDERSINTGIKSFPVLPHAKLRVGPYDIFDMEYKFQDVFPTQFPVPTHQISWGSGFGMTNGSGCA